jgi:hypothetical protein
MLHDCFPAMKAISPILKLQIGLSIYVLKQYRFEASNSLLSDSMCFYKTVKPTIPMVYGR